MSLAAGEIMIENIVVFHLTNTVKECIEILINKSISGAPLVDADGKVVSVVSESDLMKFAAQGGLDVTLSTKTNQLVKSKDLVTAQKQTTYVKLFKLFIERKVRRVLIVDSDGKIQGIVSRRDILRVFLKE